MPGAQPKPVLQRKDYSRVEKFNLAMRQVFVTPCLLKNFESKIIQKLNQ